MVIFSSEPFRLVRADVTGYIQLSGIVDAVLHFASHAAQVDYLRLPIETPKVGSLRTAARPRAGQGERRSILARLHQLDIRRPGVRPHAKSHLGVRQPDRLLAVACRAGYR